MNERFETVKLDPRVGIFQLIQTGYNLPEAANFDFDALETYSNVVEFGDLEVEESELEKWGIMKTHIGKGPQVPLNYNDLWLRGADLDNQKDFIML